MCSGETFEYKLGNRSALDWIIDQYQVSTDKRSCLTNDSNCLDDEEYIVRLIKQVITVSLGTGHLNRDRSICVVFIGMKWTFQNPSHIS